MSSLLPKNSFPSLVARSIVIAVLLSSTPGAWAQQAAKEADHSAHTQDSKSSEPDLDDQLRGLQTKVAQLEAMLKQKHSASMKMQMGAMKGMKSMSDMGKDGMKMDGGKMSKGMMGKGMTSMSGMSGKGMGGMKAGGMSDMGMDGMKKGGGMGMMGKGMAMMGKMKGMGQTQMQMPSALPGFPGASHIYHIGATAFFLDHPEHITLTPEQQTNLNKIKEDSLLKQGTFDRKIEEAEQQLWVLTGADSPDVMKIEKSVREIEKLSGDKRIDYIRAVGEAAKVLTEDQRKVLIGTLPPEHTENQQH